MQTLGTGESKPVWLEKIIRLAIPAAVIYGCIKVFNMFAPDLITFFDNFWHIVLVGGPAVLLVLYVLQNPMFLWMSYKTLCRKLTAFIIKMDPLSFMDKYVEMLNEKRKGLQKNKENLKAKQIELKREMENIKTSIEEQMNRSKAAMQIGKKEQAAHEASMAATDKETLELYMPIYKKISTNLEFLDKLDENWGRSIEKLTHTVERKRKEYKMLKDTAAALGLAQEFAKGDTEANRIYKESVAALEESVTKKLAFIEEFEGNSKGIMDSIELDKTIMNNQGLEMLEEYQKNGGLFLSEDYSTFEIKVPQGKDLFGKQQPDAILTGKKVESKTNEFSNLM